jgi:cytosine/adenosine deaminase-related metal-dependent hydrolase
MVEGDRIVSVGPRPAAPAGADVEIVEARDAILTAGLISTHAHIGGSPLDRSFIEDRGNPQFFYSGLFELLPVRGSAQDEDGTRACVDFSMAELLRGGVTTVMEIGGASEYVATRAADYRLRVYVGLAFRSGRWLTRDGRRVEWEWDEEQGRRGLAQAIEIHKKYDGAHGDLVRCFFSPAQVDTCTPELLQASKRAADERQRPWQLHTSQSVVEFNEMLGRHGKTPVAWLRDLGVLGPSAILGHAIVIGGSSWTNYPSGDVAIMADAGCSVAHAVWVFARRGVVVGRSRATGAPTFCSSAPIRIRRASSSHALGGGRVGSSSATPSDHRATCSTRRPSAAPGRSAVTISGASRPAQADLVL